MYNSFLQLREQEMAEFTEQRQEAVREKVESRLRTSQFVGDVLELFFPKMADTITVMMGGEAIEGQDDYPTVEEKGVALDPTKRLNKGPEDRDEIIR